MRTIEKIKTDYEKAVKCWETESEDCPADDCENCEYNTKKDIHELRCELLQAITADIPFDRIQEICNAERDGRCVALPCKKGDTVYAKTSYFSKNITETKAMFVWFDCFDFKIVCEGIGERTFGKTVFLTKKEAEKALKGGAE